MQVFFEPEDRELYLDILARNCRDQKVSVWAYALMENHVHHVAVPQTEEALSKTFGQTDWQYSREINQRYGWCGHLWQERFFSCPMDAAHAYNACRYVLQNPVRACLVKRPEDWPYSSARQHLGLDPPRDFMDLEALERLVGGGWEAFLRVGPPRSELEELRYCTQTGKPWGDRRFVRQLELQAGRSLTRRRARSPTASER